MTHGTGDTHSARRAADTRGTSKLFTPKYWLTTSVVLILLTFALGFTTKTMPAIRLYPVDQTLNSFHNPIFDAVASGLEILNEPLSVLVILVIALVVLTLIKNWRLAVGACFSAGAAWLSSLIPKNIVALPRPDTSLLVHQMDVQTSTLSYPSGHVVLFAVLTTAIALVWPRNRVRCSVLVVGVVLTVIMAWSRLYVGVHYPTDAIGAMMYGVGAALLVAGVWNLFAAFVFPTRATEQK